MKYTTGEAMDDETTAAAQALGATLGRLHRVLRRAAVQRSGREALPDAQVELLRVVEARPGLSVKEAAEVMRAAPNTVSTIVGELAGAGLLTRSRAPENRRVVRLELTEAAQQRLAEYGRHRANLLAAALNALDGGARRDVLRAAPHLRRLADLLGEDGDGSRPPR